MARKTAQTGKQRKKRIDLHSPDYPAAPYLCLAVLVVQAILAGSRNENWFLGFSILVFFVALAHHIITSTAGVRPKTPDSISAMTRRKALNLPYFVALTAMSGICLKGGAHGFLSLPGSVALWGVSGLVGVLLVFSRFLDRCKARRKTGTRHTPEFLDREREKGIHLMELLARIVVDFAKVASPCTAEKCALILTLFTDQLGYEGASLDCIRLFMQEEVEVCREGCLAWTRSSLDKRLRELLRDFRHTCSYESHLMLLQLLFCVAQASGPDREKALDLAREIGLALDLEPQVVQGLEAQSLMSEADRAHREQYRAERRRREEEARRQRRQEEEARRWTYDQTYRAEASREERALAVLGLDSGAKFPAIKKRYRRLIVQHHPDKVAHLGEAARRVAEEKSKELNAAYSYLEERYGR